MKYSGQKGAYISWCGMKTRCNNPKSTGFEYWGGRGITYDPQWETFEMFYRDMGDRPEGKSLERKKTELGYSKDNCEWATYVTQNRNTRKRVDNRSGLKGVSWHSTKQKWHAYYSLHGTNQQLYHGPDFFEACCARKSWENKHGVGT